MIEIIAVVIVFLLIGIFIVYDMFLYFVYPEEYSRRHMYDSSRIYTQGPFGRRRIIYEGYHEDYKQNMELMKSEPYISLFVDLVARTYDEPIRTLDNIPHEIPYRDESRLLVMINHIGQRKLLISEIDFMNTLPAGMGVDTPCRVIYVGSSPSMHLGLLLQKYPLLTVITVDPSQLTIYIPPEEGVEERHTHHSYPDRVLYFDVYERELYGLEDGDEERLATFYNAKKDISEIVNIDHPEEYEEHQKDNNEIIENGDKDNVLTDKIKKGEHRVYNFGRLHDDKLSSIITADKLDDMPLYFWSDIRTRDYKDRDDIKEFETSVLINLAMQVEWIKKCGAEKSMLKMRLPFITSVDDFTFTKMSREMDGVLERVATEYGIDYKECLRSGKYEVPKGEIHLQTRQGGHSTECRLIVDKENLNNHMIVPLSDYENKFYYFNTIYRPIAYHTGHEIDKDLNICYCQDCALEADILKKAGEDPLKYSKLMDNVLKQNLPYVKKTPLWDRIKNLDDWKAQYDRYQKIFND